LHLVGNLFESVNDDDDDDNRQALVVRHDRVGRVLKRVGFQLYNQM